MAIDLKWEKVPEVTTGGKTWFWFCRTWEFWITWDRRKHCWGLQGKELYVPGEGYVSPLYGYAASPEPLKKIVAGWFSHSE